MDEPRGCPTPGACSAVQRERELLNLVEDMQEAFAILERLNPIKIPPAGPEHDWEREQNRQVNQAATVIRAGLDRLRQEM
jgi:hypothetical protein